MHIKGLALQPSKRIQNVYSSLKKDWQKNCFGENGIDENERISTRYFNFPFFR